MAVTVSGSRTVTPGGTSGGSTTVSSQGNTTLNSSSTNITGSLNVVSTLTVYGGLVIVAGGNTQTVTISNNGANVGNPTTPIGTPGEFPPAAGVYDTSSNRVIGAVYIPGGLGVEKDLNVGGIIYGRVASATTSQQLLITATNADRVFYPVFADQIAASGTTSTGYGSFLFGDNTGTTATNSIGLTYNPSRGLLTTDKMLIASTATSTATNDGALIVNGGVGIGKDVNIGGNVTIQGNTTATNIYPSTSTEYSIGSTASTYLDAYMENIYTKVVSSTQGGVSIAPAGGGLGGYPTTDIIGDIRVNGRRPIGTAPVVTNVLWVTVDGNDTNDGRAEDPSRACRTITGAVRSPYYQPGTQIRVHAGHYLEDNPIEMKPYTTIIGSDLRTTSVEPINKTQDLFHVNSGCYLAQMQMTNGRSGLLEGSYLPEYNRGAYATAFPPKTGNDRIDLFHSPYIQNCTNQSGPWLKDGTMFLPSATVQVPKATGIADWEPNTTTLVVTVGQGTIERGQFINQGMQTPGFFNARTLLLANKPFLQEQVVAFVDQTFNRGTFTYNTVTCARDAGYIVEAVRYDTALGTNFGAVTAGNAYRRSNTSSYLVTASQQIQTLGAIEYLKDNSVQYLSGDATALARGNAAYTQVQNIISGQAPSALTFPNPVGGSTDRITAKNQLIANKSFIQADVIGWIQDQIDGNIAPFDNGFSYNSGTCYRDVGYIIDSLTYDILYGGDSATLIAARSYFVGATSQVPNENTQTVAAFNHLNAIVQTIIQDDTVTPAAATTATQVFLGTGATVAEAVIINTLTNYITSAITNGSLSGLPAPTFPSISWASAGIQTAVGNLTSAQTGLVSSMITYINNTYAKFDYDRTKCSRDTGLIVDGLALDLLYQTDSESIFSGLQYWNQGESSIAGQETTTTAAIVYLRGLATTVATNASNATIGGIVTNLFTTVTNIITNGTAGVTNQIVSNGLATSTATYVAAYNALINNIPTFKTQVISWLTTNYPTFVYNTATCQRDVGHIVQSVAFDLLHGGNKQSIKSGVYYYNFSTTTSLGGSNEIPATTAAYNFIRSILPSLLKSQPVPTPFQLGVPQNTSLTAATDYEIEALQNKIDIITDIIRNGPDEVTAKIPMNLTASGNQVIINAYNILVANREFIRAEVIAYLDSQLNFFNYNRAKCFRDVGILVENVSYDAVFGGNEKSVQSGLAYYDGVVSRISGQETQTISAIDYLNFLCQRVITNTTCTNLLPDTAIYDQVRNTVLLGGEIASRSIDANFQTITEIILKGPDTAPTMYVGTGPDAAYMSAEILMQANRQFMQQQTINYINWNLAQRSFPYSKKKCSRDTGWILDAIGLDLVYPTIEHSQSTFAGLQYWNQSGYITSNIADQINQTTSAVKYLRETAVKIIQNITPADDLIQRYSTATQVTNLEPATSLEAEFVYNNFTIIADILEGDTLGWTDRIAANGEPSRFISTYNAVALLQANKTYLATEINTFISATNPGFTYNAVTCARDVGYMIDSICFDLVHGGNKQAVQSGLYYYNVTGTSSAIATETTQTVAAFNYLANIVGDIVQNIPVVPYQTVYTQDRTTVPAATASEAGLLSVSVSTITNIIANGPGVSVTKVPINLTRSTSTNEINALANIKLNKDFIVAETIAYIERTYNPNAFVYDEDLCYRDTGLIIDAVSQDILLGGNSKSVEAGLAYWTKGYNYVAGQEFTTTAALNYTRDIALQIVANQPVAVITGTTISQVINPYFEYGGDYMPTQAISRNFFIITNIINNGPLLAPPIYQGGGIFAATGQLANDVKFPAKVTSVIELSTGTYQIGISTSTVGFGIDETIYFGDCPTFPLNDAQVEDLSQEYTDERSTWNSRKVDPIGSMGGSLVDGGVISSRSPINSFVYDAFTQVNQGGRGVRITNDGYAQLVSVFTVFCSVGVQVDNGGIASIVNSNANFGDLCLVAKGYGKRKFSGTIYNPPFKAYPSTPGPEGFDQYYPTGFWPNNAQVQVFLPDIVDRPHISLIMEVIPPDGHVNEQNLPGFLTAAPNTATITTGTITLQGIDTTDIAIGNFVYIRDIGASLTATNGLLYADTGTFVTDLGYQSVTFNKPLTAGGGDPANNNFFTMYFCGNAYYTVLSSTIADNPRTTGTNILSATNTSTDQVAAHVAAILYMNTLTDLIINNADVATNVSGALFQEQITNTIVPQTFLPLVTGGGQAAPFIDLRFGETIHIIQDATSSAQAESFYPSALRTKSGTIPPGAGSAISLIQANLDFLAAEVSAFVQVTNNGVPFVFDETLCRRDAGYIIEGTHYDIALGTNFNAITSGNAYRRGNISSYLVTATQLIQTIEAIRFIKSESVNSVNSDSTALTRSNSAYNTIVDIIATGTVTPPLTFTDPVGGDANKVNAKNRLIANRTFLQQETVSWIQTQIDGNIAPFIGFSYNTATCYRDVGYIVDGLTYDILYGGNSASIISARSYFVGATSQVPNENTQTVAAFNHLSSVAASVVRNIAVTTSTGNLVTQNLSGLAASAVEASTVTSLISIVSDVITAGSLSGIPATIQPDITWTTAPIQNAANQLLADENTIIDDMIDFINVTFGGGFVYDQTLCRRDSGYIIDGVTYDTALGTNYNAVTCGNAYQRGNASSQAVLATERVQTTQAINFIKDRSRTVMSVSSTATNRADLAYDEVIDIINYNTPDALYFTNPVGGSANQIAAKDKLIANKTFLQQETVSWIESQIAGSIAPFNGFAYNSGTCYRDVGYIVDALCYDVLYGGNSANVTAAQAYFSGTDSQVPGEVDQTIAAFNYLAGIAGDVVQGITVTPSAGNGVSQVTSGSNASATEATTIDNLIEITTDVLTAGNDNGTPAVVNPSYAWADAGVKTAADALQAAKTSIIDSTITFINITFAKAFNYDDAKCRRDVKLLMQRLIYDIESGGRYNSVMNGLSYWSRNGTHHIVTLGENVRRSDLFPDGSTANFYQRSYMSASGYVFEYVGAGTNYGALPQVGFADPVQSKETLQLDGGKVFFTSTDQNGDFRIGPGLVISQATGVLSGRTFTKSLFANMTPFILAIEGG